MNYPVVLWLASSIDTYLLYSLLIYGLTKEELGWLPGGAKWSSSSGGGGGGRGGGYRFKPGLTRNAKGHLCRVGKGGKGGGGRRR
jgi:hypothetical protein